MTEDLKVSDCVSIESIVRDREGRFLMALQTDYPYGYAPRIVDSVLATDFKTDSGGIIQADWMTREQVWCLARKTIAYLKNLRYVEFVEDRVLVERIKEVIEKRWQECPGLQVEWLKKFEELKII